MCSVASTRAASVASVSPGSHRELRLQHDRAAVELGGDEVHARAVHALAGGEHAPMRVQAAVGGQERGMNVEHAAQVARDERRGQDAHEACERDNDWAALRRAISPSCCSKAAPERRPPPWPWRRRGSRAAGKPAASARSAITTTGRAAIAPARQARTIAVMFEPRPEIRIASRSGARGAHSLMNTPRPPARTSPMICALSPRALRNSTAACARSRRHDHHHADAAVEGAVHLALVDARGALQPAEHRIRAASCAARAPPRGPRAAPAGCCR